MLDESEVISRRDAVIRRLTEHARRDDRIGALWLQGSLARGTSDPYSDIDAVLSVDDAGFDAAFAERAALLAGLGRVYSWADGQFPGLVHALLDGGVKLDLIFERGSAISAQKRQPFRVLHDRGGYAERLQKGWEPPVQLISHILGVIVRMTRQGATWPLRFVNRGQWSTLAMMELDLINAQIAQLMAVAGDPANFYSTPFSFARHLSAAQRAQLDDLTKHAMDACLRHDSAALKAVHLDVYDALVREARATCAALDCQYPLRVEDEQDLRDLLEREWPLS